MTNNVPLITVCVCTWRRPALLEQLLKSLAVQKLEGFGMEIVVADNDAAGSARDIVKRFCSHHPEVPLCYEIEPTPGVSFARNRTVQMARGDYLAFIDDDEVAAPDWLAGLYTCLTETGADAVFGPVLPIFPPGSKVWAIECGLFERPRYADGTPIGSGDGRTGNALLRARWVRLRKPHPFDEAFALTGGEDHDLFKWIESQGGKFAWVDRAIVEELVPLERQSIPFLLKRRFRASVTYWRGKNATRSRISAWGEAGMGVLGGVVFLLAGALLAPVGLGRAIRFWVKAVNGFGRAAALSNIRLAYYGVKT